MYDVLLHYIQKPPKLHYLWKLLNLISVITSRFHIHIIYIGVSKYPPTDCPHNMENIENAHISHSDKSTDAEEVEDVVDYTKATKSYETGCGLDTIRITDGINLQDLHTDGIVFSPEQIDDSKKYEMSSRDYFDNHSAELESIISEADRRHNQIEDYDYLNDFETVRKSMFDISGNGSVMKRVLKDGLQTTGSVPDDGVVKIHYSMHLEGQDEPYDSSTLRGKAEKYKIGDGQLITGLEIGILTMKKQEKAQFWINYNYAFGVLGCPPRIPAEAQILANVELLDFTEAGNAEAYLSMTSEDRKKRLTFDQIEKAASIEHKNGNNDVRQNDWRYAVRHYERGVKLLQETSLKNKDEEVRCQKLLLKLQLNSAHCYLKLQRPKKACTACKEALQIDDNNTKALYRFGKAKRMLEDLESAQSLLLRAQKNAPNDMAIGDELRSLEDQLVKNLEDEKLLCSSMFGNVKSEKKEKMDKSLYDMIHTELNQFRNQPETEMVLGQVSSLQYMKALRLAASNLELLVKVDETKSGDGNGVVVVRKP